MGAARMDLKALIAEVPDYPKPGVSFKDLSPLLASPEGFREAVRALAEPFRGSGVRAVIASEARGFLWGGAVARELDAGLVPVRKPKKLPRATYAATYALEYGTDELHIHRDALAPGTAVLLVDDVLATGGTAKAMIDLAARVGATVTGLAFVVELAFLNGRAALSPHGVHAVIRY